MIHRFNPHRGHILVPADLTGPVGSTSLPMVLDTGSTHTMVNRESLELVGVNVDVDAPVRGIITGSGRVSAPTVVVPFIEIAGLKQFNFPIVAFDFPRGAGISGVLGLDFFRGTKLTLDFNSGLLEIN